MRESVFSSEVDAGSREDNTTNQKAAVADIPYRRHCVLR
jgi:hypothetical protein